MNSEKGQSLPDGYRIREYRTDDPEDSRKCQHVEEHASQMRNAFLRKFVVVSQRHLRRFHSRSELYPRSFILVCEAPNSDICGVVAVGLKKVALHGRVIEAGYMFELRVHEAHQRRGIGRALSLACEQRCRELRTELLYLSVNNDNPRAKQLYKTLGFSPASTRSPAVSFVLTRTPSKKPACRVSPLARAQALEMTQRHYHMRDMFPADLEKLFASEFYAGSYVAHLTEHASDVRETDPWAVVSLWDSNHLTSFAVHRLFVPFSWISSPITGALTHAAVIATQLYLGKTAYGSYLRHAYVRAFLTSAVLVFGVWFYVKASRFMRAILGVLSKRSPKMRARIFAPVVNDANPQSGQLMEDLVQVVFDKLAADGYATAVCNLDEKYTHRDRFPKQRFKTLFLQKPLVPNTDIVEEPLPFDPNGFFDPRDIS